MLTPSAISARIAGMPAGVAGTLIIRLGRSTISQSRMASEIVVSVCWASRGDTSRLTNPSRRCVRSYTGRRTSAASWMSRTASRS